MFKRKKMISRFDTISFSFKTGFDCVKEILELKHLSVICLLRLSLYVRAKRLYNKNKEKLCLYIMK